TRRIDTEHAHLAFTACSKAFQDLHRCRLAGAVWPEEREDLALLHVEVDARDCFGRRVALPQPADADHRLGCRHHSTVPTAGCSGACRMFDARTWSRRRGPGAHQFHLPSSSISDGTSSPRTTDASMR